MHIGLKNGNIVVFSETLHGLEINAAMRGITLDSQEETDEKIVPYHNTANDGIYFKASQVPPMPSEMANESAKFRRRELYALESDPLTNNISVLRDRIAMGDFESEDERTALLEEISNLYHERRSIREQIVAENPFAE
ncbi:MAG: hypothetical protein LBI56_04410 [Puniceicoccales bacterium]|jgi:hypothetical protein|nr:hypothetical protein [Puniceicoccales bacterium]